MFVARCRHVHAHPCRLSDFAWCVLADIDGLGPDVPPGSPSSVRSSGDGSSCDTPPVNQYTSSTEDSRTDRGKYCDCCYCEFFGHQPVSTYLLKIPTKVQPFRKAEMSCNCSSDSFCARSVKTFGIAFDQFSPPPHLYLLSSIFPFLPSAIKCGLLKRPSHVKLMLANSCWQTQIGVYVKGTTTCRQTLIDK